MAHEFFTATVTKNDDDQFLGRIKVACAELLGSSTVEVPVWVEPSLDWGWFIVPDVGELVKISIESHNEDDDIQGQIMVDGPDIQWDGARYYSENEESENPTRVHPDFKTNYGKRRGFSTPYGHVLLFDDTNGSSEVYISAVVKKHSTEPGEAVAAELVNQIKLDKDGIHLSVLGDTSKHVALAEHLQTLYAGMKSAYDNHTHSTGMGPSGAPGTGGVGSATLPVWDSKIVSSKISIPDEE